MKSRTVSLHPLLILLAVAMASALFVMACGGGSEATAVPQAVEEAEVTDQGEVAQVPEAVEEAEVAQVAEEAEDPELSVLEAIALEPEIAEEAALAEEVPNYGGTLTWVTYANHLTLDPPITGLSITDVSITQAVYDNLLMIQPDFTVKPELATSWEANEDLSSYTVHLRKGVKFHHGKEFKAEDVVSTFTRLADPILDSPARTTFEPIKEMVIIDDYTVRFDLHRPNAFFLDTLSIYQARIMPSDIDPKRFVLEEFGTGPFIIVEHLPGERTIMERNPDYWEEGKPYLDEFVVQYIPEAATRAEALKSGDIDVVYQLEPQSAEGLDAHPDTVVLSKPSLSWIGLVMRTDTPPFDDKLVRQAMQAATDRQGINQAALLGLGAIAYDHIIPEDDPRFAPQHKPPEYDPELARSLLEQAGYPDGIDVTLHTADVGAGVIGLALAFKESAKAAGINVTVNRRTADGYWTDVWNVEPFTITSWYGRPNPDQGMSIQNMSGVDWNAPRHNNAELDELIIRARGESLEDQIVTYAEVQRILVDEVPRIIPVFQPWLYGAQANVRGIVPHPLGWPIAQDGWFAD